MSVGKRNAQVWGKWEQGARSDHTGVQKGEQDSALERSQPGPWGPSDEPADWDPGVPRAQS